MMSYTSDDSWRDAVRDAKRLARKHGEAGVFLDYVGDYGERYVGLSWRAADADPALGDARAWFRADGQHVERVDD